MLNTIIGYLETAWDLLLNMIQTLLMSVVFVTQSVNITVSLVTFLPSIIGTALVITIAVYVIRFLLLK